MIPVDEAQRLCLAQVRTLGQETVPLQEALGRVMIGTAAASRPQPPFAASAMDGYAVRDADAGVGTRLSVVGEAAAGAGSVQTVAPGTACRIFTGAPVPVGATRVILQEDVSRDGDTIVINAASSGLNIRPQGADFGNDYRFKGPRLLGPADLALLAALGHGTVSVARRPKVHILATGDELVMPGTRPRPDQIFASNIFALSAIVTQAGGVPHLMPIAGDTVGALQAAFDEADAAQTELMVTIGGASVGDHDLIAGVAAARGIPLAFHNIAMRPGKPLMAGSSGTAAFLGLPGNPVSAIVCGHLFLAPMVRACLGLTDVLPPVIDARLTAPVEANGPRAHYMRARFAEGQNGRIVTPFDRQDSSFLTVLSEANCLLVRPPRDAALPPGEVVSIHPI